MADENHKYKRSDKVYATTFVHRDKKNKLTMVKKGLKKNNSAVSKDVPDQLVKNDSDFFKVEKAQNYRKTKKRMTQLPQNVDKPDVLLGIKEYKEIREQPNFHNIKKMSVVIPDKPDIIESNDQNSFSNIPGPKTMISIKRDKYEEEKNESQIKDKKEEILTNIKGILKEENFQVNSKNNNIDKMEDKKEEEKRKKEEEEKIKKLEEEEKQRKLEEEKKKQIEEEKQKKLEEEKQKRLEEEIMKNKQLEEQKLLENKKINEENGIRDIEMIKSELQQKEKQNILKENRLKEIEEQQKQKEEQLKKREKEIKEEEEKNKKEQEKRKKE